MVDEELPFFSGEGNLIRIEDFNDEDAEEDDQDQSGLNACDDDQDELSIAAIDRFSIGQKVDDYLLKESERSDNQAHRQQQQQ